MQHDTGSPVSVVLVEPQRIYRRAIALLLETAGADFVLIGEARQGQEGVALAKELRADIALIAAIDPDDYAYVRQMIAESPTTRVVVLSLRSDGWAVMEALRAGAAGFVPKWVDLDDILVALRAVARGRSFVHPGVAGAAVLWASSRDTASSDLRSMLTQREREILGLMSEGYSSAKIAQRLSVSPRTIETHLANVYRKLGVHGRIEAAREYQASNDPVPISPLTD